jgi:hypothetical protein
VSLPCVPPLVYVVGCLLYGLVVVGAVCFLCTLTGEVDAYASDDGVNVILWLWLPSVSFLRCVVYGVLYTLPGPGAAAELLHECGVVVTLLLLVFGDGCWSNVRVGGWVDATGVGVDGWVDGERRRGGTPGLLSEGSVVRASENLRNRYSSSLSEELHVCMYVYMYICMHALVLLSEGLRV